MAPAGLFRWLSMALLVAVGLFGMAAVHPAEAQEFKVIVNNANPVTELSSDAVARLFLKESATFPGGVPATPVEPAKGSATRTAFAKTVLGRTVQSLDTYWQEEIFSGRDVPPASKSTDDEVVAFVRNNPGAIGYVSGAASTPGVKVITVN
ncbi:MAG: substrate-binding domain-containing protein [Gemmatimonadota bacterium]|nr:substrate-binding domain-containing protein [Gemmatimonadota bacterium]